MIFGQLMECKMRIFFLEKSCTKCDWEASPRPLHKYFWLFYFETKNAFTKLSTDFRYWVFNYLMHRQHFIQIDSNCSSLLAAKYGVSDGSILGPILINLCVADMSSITPNSNFIQYADDSTLYRSCKINKKLTSIKELEKDLNSIAKWSIETNLVFNTGKTKFMLIASKHGTT